MDLVFSKNNVRDVGCKHTYNMLTKLNKLTCLKLYLRDNGITDIGAEYVCKGIRRLRDLE